METGQALEYLSPEAPPCIDDVECTKLGQVPTVDTDIGKALNGECSVRPLANRIDFKTLKVYAEDEQQNWANRRQLSLHSAVLNAIWSKLGRSIDDPAFVGAVEAAQGRQAYFTKSGGGGGGDVCAHM